MARSKLSGYWLRAIVALCVWLAVEAIVTLIFQLAMALLQIQSLYVYYAWLLSTLLATVLIASPFMFGFKELLWQRSADGQASVSLVLVAFCSVRKVLACVALHIVKYAIIWVPVVLVCVPYAVIGLFADRMPESVYVLLNYLFSALPIAGVVYGVYMMLRTVAVDYLFIDGDKQGVLSAIGRSFRLTKGKIKHVLSFYLKFLLWLILTVTGIAALYVTPYFEMAKCLLVRDLIKHHV